MITSIEPVVELTGRYTIKETSGMLEIDRHTLMRYVKAGYIRPMFKKNAVCMNQPRIRFLGSEIVRFWRTYV